MIFLSGLSYSILLGSVFSGFFSYPSFKEAMNACNGWVEAGAIYYEAYEEPIGTEPWDFRVSHKFMKLSSRRCELDKKTRQFLGSEVPGVPNGKRWTRPSNAKWKVIERFRY